MFFASQETKFYTSLKEFHSLTLRRPDSILGQSSENRTGFSQSTTNLPLSVTCHQSFTTTFLLMLLEHSSGHPDIRDYWARMLEFFVLLHFYVHKTIDTAKAKVNLVTRLAEYHTRKVKKVVIRVGVWCNLSARRIMGNVFDID